MQHNPYNFVKMEWWTKDKGHVMDDIFVGFTANGDIYMSFDLRKDLKGKVTPYFSGTDKIGVVGGLRKETYDWERDLFEHSMTGWSVKEVLECEYEAYRIYKMCNFVKEQK